MGRAKPFIKWVGGKSQLIEQLEALLPANFDVWDNVTYIEPFVGGGAMVFYMLGAHPNIKRAVICDINGKLTTCYKVVRDQPQKLISYLSKIQAEYLSLPNEEERKIFYLEKRVTYNTKEMSDIECTVLFFFLNRTCFNGLYRENKNGAFNVPFGRYANPTICDPATIMADSQILQNVDILTGDFEQTLYHAKENTLFYLDPPYRPLNSTSSFNDYVKEKFNDDAQRRLKAFCDKVNAAGYSFMLSNSDSMGFFDDLYADYRIERVWASRCVNANGAKRGKLTEILVRNYDDVQKSKLHTDNQYKIAL